MAFSATTAPSQGASSSLPSAKLSSPAKTGINVEIQKKTQVHAAAVKALVEHGVDEKGVQVNTSKWPRKSNRGDSSSYLYLLRLAAPLHRKCHLQMRARCLLVSSPQLHQQRQLQRRPLLLLQRLRKHCSMPKAGIRKPRYSAGTAGRRCA